MLTEISITHLATIEKAHLELNPGTTVVTGETGAGKSILIDAIELALGSRATSDLVRPEQDKADIHVRFNIEKLPDVKQWLKQYDFEDDAQECIIRRTIYRDGRSRSYINNIPTTLQLLREISDLLINIHGQHEHQALFKPDTQRDMLDCYAGHTTLVTQVSSLAYEWQTLSNTLEKLRQSDHERVARSDFLRFQLRELEELRLGPDEFQTLDQEHKQLAHAGDLLQNMNVALQYLTEQENHNVLTLLHQSIHALEPLQEINPKIHPWIEALKNVVIQIRDTENEVRHFLNDTDIDPERLTWVEQRIGTLFDMARKYKTSPGELFALQQRLAAELAEIDTSDERLAALEQQRLVIEKNYSDAANKLSASRKKSAKKLEQEITQIIQELSLPHGKLQIQFVTEGVTPFASYGHEKIIFLITTNIGQPLQPLAKVASGGELSRISLAIHMATAEQHTIPTLIFDEVDVGISGGTAEMVGNLLRRLGKTHQLLCITHLPQVAAKGHQHWLVEKHHTKSATFTRISDLAKPEKIRELARMLGGIEITQKTLAHAEEILEAQI
jgi:DNA repair protein RecN (Recombination protein N)